MFFKSAGSYGTDLTVKVELCRKYEHFETMKMFGSGKSKNVLTKLELSNVGKEISSNLVKTFNIHEMKSCSRFQNLSFNRAISKKILNEHADQTAADFLKSSPCT